MFNSREIYERVDKMRLDRGWSIYRLAKLSHVTSPAITGWRDKGSSPTLFMIENIANAFGVHPISLLLGSDKLSELDTQHQELVTRWDALSKEQKDSFMQMLRTMSREPN